MASIIMLVCVIGFIGGIRAAFKALSKKRFKKALVWVVIVIASGFTFQITGASDMAKEQQELVDKQMDEEAPNQKDEDVVEEDLQPVSPNPKEIEKIQDDQVEEPKIKKEQYDVVWGPYDNEWVYSDEWTGEGFENFDEAMNVLNQCMRKSEEETEMCVYDYLSHK